jgi:guanine deaminase
MNRKFMEEATRWAIESVEKGWGGPFGAVIVKDGEIIGRGQNRVLLTGCPVFHAEITAIIDASSRLTQRCCLAATITRDRPRDDRAPARLAGFGARARTHAQRCEIYINVAPCPMCMSAICWSRIDHLYFGCGFSDAFPYEDFALPWEQRRGIKGDAKFRT